MGIIDLFGLLDRDTLEVRLEDGKIVLELILDPFTVFKEVVGILHMIGKLSLTSRNFVKVADKCRVLYT